jgi:hypothetical protein
MIQATLVILKSDLDVQQTHLSCVDDSVSNEERSLMALAPGVSGQVSDDKKDSGSGSMVQ